MAVYYVSLDVRAFAAANPGFADLQVPEEPGLTLDPSCQSCADPTDNVVEIVSGSRMGTRSESFEQPVYLCADCLSDRDRARARLAVIRAARAVTAVVVATVISAALRVGAGVSEIASTAAWLLLVPAVYMVGVMAVRAPRASGRWQPVEVFWFRDPRKGEDAEFLCVRIENPAQAARFAVLNPHAIDAERWEASYAQASSSQP